MSNLDEIKKIMLEAGKELINSLEEEIIEDDYDSCDCDDECCCDMEDDMIDPLVYFNHNVFYNKKIDYNKNKFIQLIFEIGSSQYNTLHVNCLDSEPIFDSVKQELLRKIESPYFSVREQKGCIAIAAPIYIRNAPNVIANSLNVIPEMFIEVSGPVSTVLIIDCEKEWLRSKYLGIGEEEWLL